MDLCLCFGEPSRSRLMQRLSASEFDEWRQYSRLRPLPSHTPRHLLQFMSLWLSAHSKKGAKTATTDDFLVYRQTTQAVPQNPKESRKQAEGLQAAFRLMVKAKNGSTR